ncbi:MAG: hypothetical protein ABFE08_09385 [Armatimonadia bacterium]
MEAQRLTNLWRLHRAAVGQHEALRHEAELERAEVQQRRGALERVVDEHTALQVTAREAAAVRGHRRRYGEWLVTEAKRLRLELAARQGRLRELRAAEVVAAQEARVLERLIERLELAQTQRQRRAEQELVDHFALRQSRGRRT